MSSVRVSPSSPYAPDHLAGFSSYSAARCSHFFGLLGRIDFPLHSTSYQRYVPFFFPPGTISLNRSPPSSPLETAVFPQRWQDGTALLGQSLFFPFLCPPFANKDHRVVACFQGSGKTVSPFSFSPMVLSRSPDALSLRSDDQEFLVIPFSHTKLCRRPVWPTSSLFRLFLSWCRSPRFPPPLFLPVK